MRQAVKVSHILLMKRIILFLVFHLVFLAAVMPLLIFYGPFRNVKRTVTGMSMNTLKHQYIAKFFLSDQAISRVLENSCAVDPTEKGGEVKELKFGNRHTDRIEIYDIKGTNLRGKMLVIFDPTRIVAGYSSRMPGSGETTSVIAGRNGAVAAINAGGFMDAVWAGTGGAPMGFIIHDGKVVYDQIKNENTRQDTAAFTDKGMLIVGKHSIAQLKNLGVKEAVSFGPPLIVNGKPNIKKGDGGWGISPRTAIGQREDGAVIFMVIDGRDILHSFGATLREVQDILLKYGAVNAVNLDGGSSTTMYFNGRIINKPSDALGERTVPSAFMAVPVKEGDGL